MSFPFILLVLCSVTGVLWTVDHFWARKKRPQGAKEPVWVEWGASFFPVIFFVFALRSFIVEPFRIPSGSMIPTLQIGDFILVNKFTYGIRLPVINTKIIDINKPQRGDVFVFHYPPDPSVDYIKRIVGLPGDTVAYQNKRLTINGEEVPFKKIDDYLHPGQLYYSPRYSEKLGNVEHETLIETESPAYIAQSSLFPFRENCLYNNAGVICKVPEGHYFAMGDNRDNSADSRVWGFVPEANIVGKAYFVWMHAESLVPPRGFDFGRIGSFK
ncbi:MAG: signal peptidase I [Rhodocyclaceae bacterium]|nr:signal peptidase I [Rhodocyclaceae bacterium]